MEFLPIGHIESCFKEKFGTPRQPGLVPSAPAQLILHPDRCPEGILSGLDDFSHLWIIFVFHLNSNKNVKGKIAPPRLNGERVGVFASRSPLRPNPIGLSLAKIEKVCEDKIILSGVDIVDQTPVLDIKPYLPETDAPLKAQAGWTRVIRPKQWPVQFGTEAQAQLERLQTLNPSVDWQSLITETIQQDLRPRIYRNTHSDESRYKQDFGVQLFDINVRFRLYNNEWHVLSISGMR